MKNAITEAATQERIKVGNRRIWGYWVVWGLLLVSNGVLAYFAVLGATSQPQELFGGVVRIQTADGTGSGFLILDEYVMTAAHVVEKVGNQVQVEFTNGTSIAGEVVASGYDQWQDFETSVGQVREGATPHDWALVRLEAPQDAALALFPGESTATTVGEDVWAIGYPAGQQQNVSRGVLSGKGDNELRTDASIDPGYSGGALYSDRQKAVIGILVTTPSINGTRAMSVHNAVPIEVALAQCAEAGFILN